MANVRWQGVAIQSASPKVFSPEYLRVDRQSLVYNNLLKVTYVM